MHTKMDNSLLNDNQKQVLIDLAPHGLTEELLLKSQCRSSIQCSALKHLMLGQTARDNFEVEQALNIISYLSEHDCFKLYSEGEHAVQMIKLNPTQKQVLTYLLANSSKTEHEIRKLLISYYHEKTFDFPADTEYLKTLKYLLNKNYTIKGALRVMMGLDYSQLNGVQNGLEPDEVRGLSLEQIKAYLVLKPYGLKPELLLAHPQGWDYSGVQGVRAQALIHMTTQRGYNNFSFEGALIELERLVTQEIEGIIKGFDPADVIDLNKHQINTLQFTKDKKAPDLLRRFSQDTTEENYSECHHTVCMMLMSGESKLSLQDALNLLAKLKWHQVKGMSQGLSFNDVINLNADQIRLLREHKNYGLTGELLRKYPCKVDNSLIHRYGTNYRSAYNSLFEQYKRDPNIIGAILAALMPLKEKELDDVAMRVKKIDLVIIVSPALKTEEPMNTIKNKASPYLQYDSARFFHLDNKEFKRADLDDEITDIKMAQSKFGQGSFTAKRIKRLLDGQSPNSKQQGEEGGESKNYFKL